MARLAAVPDTRLCLDCKSRNDESPLKSTAPILKRALVESSIGDLEELQKSAWELGGIE
jgi:hypothetical protein